MGDSDGTDPDQKRVTFRAPEEKVERLDRLIDRRNGQRGEGEDRISRSGLLRGCIDDLIQDLENELGNRNRATIKAD